MRTMVIIIGIVALILAIIFAFLVFVVFEKKEYKVNTGENIDENSYFSGKQDFFLILMLFSFSVFSIIFIIYIIPQIPSFFTKLANYIQAK